MLGVPVSSEIDFSLESFVAKSASEWLISAMLPHVCDEVGTLAERLRADRAFVWFLSGVNVSVLFHV